MTRKLVLIKSLTDDEIIDIYFQINHSVDMKQADGENGKMNRYREALTGLMIQMMVRINELRFININLTGLNEKEDPKLAKKVFGLLLSKDVATVHILKWQQILFEN